VRIVPNHVCVVVNMMDEVVMVRGDEIIGTLPVAARGKLRQSSELTFRFRRHGGLRQTCRWLDPVVNDP